MIAFTIPGEPTGKGRPRISTRGGFARAYTPAKTRDYEAVIAKAASDAMNNDDLIEGPCSLFVSAVYGVPKSWSKRDTALALAGNIRPTGPRNDLDNVVKAASDAINGVVYKDDGQVVTLSAVKSYGAVPGIHVEVARA